MVALRKSEEFCETLSVGDIQPILLDHDDLIAYKRIGNGKEVVVICSFATHPLSIDVDFEVKKTLLSNYPEVKTPENGKLKIEPFEAVIFEV
jgi:oligo-1,6-glucosidase/alpha-glucosidase